MALVTVSNENVVCSPCSRLEIYNEATHWCKNCKEYICYECFTFHKKLQLLSSHEMTKIKEAPKEKNLFWDIPGEVFCIQHPNKNATGFCISDRKSYCFDCLQSMDLSLKEVIGVEKIAKNLDSNMLGRDVSILQDMCEILRKSLTEVDSSESHFNKSVEDILQSTQEMAVKAKEHIDELLIQTDATLKELKNEEQKQILKRKTELGNFIDFLELRVTLLQTNTLKSMEILTLSLNTKQELCAKTESLRNCFENSELHAVKLQPNRIFQQIEVLKSLGEIQLKSQPSNALNDCQQVEELINQLQQGLFPRSSAQVEVIPDKQKLETKLKTVQKKKDKDTNAPVNKHRKEMLTSLKKIIKHADIDTEYLYDVASLPDGRLVVTDLARSKLLLFDDSVTLQAQYDIENIPFGVCVSADGSHVFLVHGNGTLVIYRLQGGLKKVSRVKVQEETRGVGVSRDTIITGHKDNITLYNMKGKKLSSISKEGYYTYICVSPDGSKFYHKDGHHVVCRTVSDLSEVFRYSHPELRNPCGIACDRHGNILVAGHDSGNIIMIDRDGTQGRVLVDKLQGISCSSGPTGVCCHPQRDEFVVLSYVWCGENVNAMQVHEMK